MIPLLCLRRLMIKITRKSENKYRLQFTSKIKGGRKNNTMAKNSQKRQLYWLSLQSYVGS